MRYGLRVRAWSDTSTGMVREGNEDSYFKGSTVFAVADGMGGHQAGEVASATALEPIKTLDGAEFRTPYDAITALTEAIAAANRTVFEKAADDPELHGMGTTLTALLIREGRFHLAHVGDSRAYLLRSGEFSPLTTDHTLVQQLIEEGRLSEDEADTHPQRSVITRAIGVERVVTVDTPQSYEMLPDDQILLCSDGLTGPVKDDEIAQILGRYPDGQEACQALIDAANAAGGPDNITVVLLRVEGEPSADGAAATARAGDTQDLGLPINGSTASAGSVTQIRTRDEEEVGFDAVKMGRYGGPQGVETRPLPEPSAGRLRRGLYSLLAVVVILALVVTGGYLLLSRAYFVGDHNGRIAIFRGIPQQIGGLKLHRVVRETDIRLTDLPPFRRGRIQEGIPYSELDEAREYVNGPLRAEADRATERKALDSPVPVRPPAPAPSPGLRPSPRPLPAPIPDSPTLQRQTDPVPGA